MKTNRVKTHLSELDLVGKIADMKESHYKNTLMLTAAIELLVEKELITREEILTKAEKLESDLLTDLYEQFQAENGLNPKSKR